MPLLCQYSEFAVEIHSAASSSMIARAGLPCDAMFEAGATHFQLPLFGAAGAARTRRARGPNRAPAKSVLLPNAALSVRRRASPYIPWLRLWPAPCFACELL